MDIPHISTHEYVPKNLNLSHDVSLTPKKADISTDRIITKSTPLPEMNAANALSEISFFYEDGMDEEGSDDDAQDSTAQFILI